MFCFGGLAATSKDKEETAQWLSSPATCRAILEACLSKVSSLKGQACLVHHMSLYDGAWEQVVCEMMTELADSCHLALFSQTDNPTVFQYAATQVKDKLVEAEKYKRVHYMIHKYNVLTKTDVWI